MKLIENLFGTKCAECGQKIKGERFQAPGSAWICQTCHSKLDAERKVVDPKIQELLLSMVETNMRNEGNFRALGTTMLAAHQMAQGLNDDDKKCYLLALDSISESIDYSDTKRAGATMAFVQSMKAVLEK